MIIKKVILAISILSISSVPAFAYTEISCSSDPAFAANSCSQCFDWGNKSTGSDLGFLSDVWINGSNNDVLLYKEEQEMPTMINLWGDNASWTQEPTAVNFWEYTDDFNSLYSELEEGYILSSGWKVTWIKSKLGYSYTLSSNTAPEWANIWMLVFPLTTHKLLSDWEITIDGDLHKECVLYKSGEPSEEVIVPPTKLPDTWPAEYILLLILAMIFGFWVVKIRQRG